MKKCAWLPLALLLLLLPVLALAQEAEDLTNQCKLSASSRLDKPEQLHDQNWGTAFTSSKQRSPYLQADAPKGKKMYGVYVCFGNKLAPWQVQASRSGKWVTVYESEGVYAHEYVPLPKGESAVRIRITGDKQTVLKISELCVLGEGDVPASVQQWQPAPEKADLMVIAGHPDDEILFLGGAIPTYAGERKMNVVVVYMTAGNMEDLQKHNKVMARRSELLNGLWEMGVRTYPVINDLWDKYSQKLDTGYSAWGKTKTQQLIVSLLRQYKPEVVLTHDVNGEYGHGAHRVCADVAQYGVVAAADANKYPDSAGKYGTWQVKKLYLHLYKEHAIEMDWDQPLTAFDGRTGYEVAADAYRLHTTQQTAGQKNPKTGKFEYFIVEPRDSDYSCYRFGLAYTAVGYDEEMNDFFEHIPGY